MPMGFDVNGPPNVSANPKGNEMDLVATHQRLLVAACVRTKGDVLELGVGWYSTPLLHEIAVAQGRLLVTIDNNEHWLKPFKMLGQEHLHKLILAGWWGNAPLERTYWGGGRWSLVFLDQGQPIEREYAVHRLIQQTDVFVMHDTEEEFAYGYGRTLPMFKYKFTDKSHRTWTTVASNTVDVTKWGLVNIPNGSGPEQGVT